MDVKYITLESSSMKNSQNIEGEMGQNRGVKEILSKQSINISSVKNIFISE
jgi:hypothetical protein